MSNVENEVVSITFDNDGFQRGIAEVLVSLDELKASLDSSSAGDAFKGLEEAAKNVDMSGIENAIDSINEKFSALGAIAFTAIQGVTTSAVDAAKNMFDRTLGSIISGGQNRYLAIEQAKFQFRGLGLDVEAAMASALEAVRGTAYGLDEAATLAGVFGSAGLKAGEEMTGGLRAVAGIATQTTSSFSEIGAVFQNIASLGHVTTNDLNSLALRGLGFNTVAQKMGITVEELRQRAADSSISFKEFASVMDDAFGAHAQEANKTYSGSLANLHAAMNRLGEVFVGPKLEATRNIFNALAPVIDKVKDALLPLVDLWKLFVNIQAIKTINFLEGLNVKRLEKLVPIIGRIFKNIYSAVGSFLTPIKEAFREIFPPTTMRDLKNFAVAIRNFTKGLALSEETADKVKRIFAGLFAVISIGIEIVKGIWNVFVDVAGALSGVGEGFLGGAASVGDFLVALKELLVDGGGIADFFEEVGKIITDFIDAMKNSQVIKAFGNALSDIGSGIANLFGGGSDAGATAFGGSIDRVSQRFETLKTVISGIARAVATVWSGLTTAVSAAFDWLIDTFGGLGEAIAGAMGKGDFNTVLDVINTALFGGILALFWKFLKDGLTVDLTGGVMGTLSESFEQLTGVLEAMELQLKAGALMKIAKAIALLAGAILVLSLIDSEDLTKALTAMAAGFAEMGTVMYGFSKLGLKAIGGAPGLLALAWAMMLIAGAMILLSVATLIFSTMDVGSLIKGLVGVGTSMMGLALVAKTLSKAAPDLIVTGGAILAVAFAVVVLALATAIFAKMQWDTLLRGLFGVAAGLIGLTLAMKFIPADAGAKAPSLLALGFSLIAIAKAVEKMGNLSWDQIAKGLVGLGIALGGIVLVANEMKGSIAGAVAIGIMALALIGMAFAVQMFADIGWQDLIVGLLGMAAALLIVGGLAAVAGAFSELIILGALALIPMIFALGLLANVIEHMGQIGFAEFGTAMLFIAAALAVLALVSVALAPAVPTIFLLGIALTALGLGLALIGAGVYLTAAGLKMLGEAGVSGIQSLKTILMELMSLIPELMEQFAVGMLEFGEVLLEHAPQLVELFAGLIDSFLQAIIEEAPQLAEAFRTVILEMLATVEELVPEYILTGVRIIIAVLEGIATAIPQICAAARGIIMGFIGCLVENYLMLPRAGWQLIMKLTDGIRQKVGAVILIAGQLIGQFVSAIVRGAAGLIGAGARAIGGWISGILSRIGEAISKGRTAVGNFVNGLRSKAGELLSTGLDAAGDFIRGIGLGATGLLSEGLRIAGDLIQGIVNGIGNGVSLVTDAIRDLASDTIGAIGGFFGIGSPSRVFHEIGGYLMEGLALGIDDHSGVIESVDKMGNDVIASMTSSAEQMAKVFDGTGLVDINPTITPVLDLTMLQDQAKGITGLLASNPLDADLSFDQANVISANAQQQQEGESTSESTEPKQIIFEQNITAPTPLSPAEIYRATRSQITLAKRELEVA